MRRSRGTGPRATKKKRCPFTVGRGPVPRHAAIAGDRPPRYEKKTLPLHGGRGPSDATRAGERVSLAMRFGVRPHHSCRARSSEALACWFPSDPDLFGSGCSRTTEMGPMPAGRRDILVPIRTQSRPGGFSYPVHRDREVYPTGKPSKYETPSGYASSARAFKS